MTKQRKISAEDFSAWRDSPITEAVFRHLREMRDIIEKAWLAELHGDVSIDPRAIQLLQVELKSKIAFIDNMLALELEDIQEDDEGSDKRTAVKRAVRPGTH